MNRWEIDCTLGSKTYSGQYGDGTRKAFPGSAKEKTRVSIAAVAPAVRTICAGLKNNFCFMA